MRVIHILHPQQLGWHINDQQSSLPDTKPRNRGAHTQPRSPNRCHYLQHSCYLDRTSSVESHAVAVVNNTTIILITLGRIKFIYVLYLPRWMVGFYGIYISEFTILMENVLGVQVAWSIFLDLFQWNMVVVNPVWCWREIQLTGWKIWHPTRWYLGEYADASPVEIGWFSLEFWIPFLPSGEFKTATNRY